MKVREDIRPVTYLKSRTADLTCPRILYHTQS
jgi:hypothetical protein